MELRRVTEVWTTEASLYLDRYRREMKERVIEVVQGLTGMEL